MTATKDSCTTVQEDWKEKPRSWETDPESPFETAVKSHLNQECNFSASNNSGLEDVSIDKSSEVMIAL